MSKQSDHITLEAIRNGSDDALREVYVENRTLFLNFARKYGLTREDILDVYQDTYIAFHDNIQSGRLIELTSSISTYMIGIGRRILMHKLRSNKKQVKFHSMEPISAIDDQLDRFDIVLDEMTDQQVKLKEKFKLLHEACRKILTWFYYNRHSIRQIVELGGFKNENSAKSQKSRCLKRLKESILKTAQHAT